MFVIKRNDGKYVARLGRASSYTTQLQYARVFAASEDAKANCCDNEYVVSVDAEIYSEGRL